MYLSVVALCEASFRDDARNRPMQPYYVGVTCMLEGDPQRLKDLATRNLPYTISVRLPELCRFSLTPSNLHSLPLPA
jgi:hypothetical protein